MSQMRDEAVERINVLRRAMIWIKREARKVNPDPDAIYTKACEALEATETP